ncbi:MAG: cell division protein FtsQ/DivIB, partial [Eubacteriales bacterium]
ENITGQNIFFIDYNLLESKIVLNPYVEKVQFEKSLPNTLTILVEERAPAALILVSGGVLEVDYNGIILKYYESWPKANCPVITGIEVSENVGPGQKIDDADLANLLKLIGQADKELLPLVSEVHLNAIGQVYLYLSSGVEVRLGYGKDFTEKLSLLNELCKTKEYQSVESAVKYIDLTSGKPVLGR